jgi:hypothetical protein
MNVLQALWRRWFNRNPRKELEHLARIDENLERILYLLRSKF